MISESSYWKGDLLKLGLKLERRIIQKRWGSKNIFALEKDLFIGFYAIRKLIESKKISDSLKLKEYQILEFEYHGTNNSIIDYFSEEKYNFDKPNKKKLTIAQLCNQFIHSFYFSPYVSGELLIGFFICSDHQREKGIYMVTILDIIDIYRIIGSNYPASIKKIKNEHGKIVMEIE